MRFQVPMSPPCSAERMAEVGQNSTGWSESTKGPPPGVRCSLAGRSGLPARAPQASPPARRPRSAAISIAACAAWRPWSRLPPPALASAWFGLAQIRLEQHLPSEAIGFLKQALAIQPDADGYHYALGVALEQVSRLSDALEAYRTELRLHPYQTGARKAVERLQSTVQEWPVKR